MNSSLSAYTHLESLLLFNYLHKHGITGSVFGRISELLKKNPDITSDKRFQSGRLSPDALRNVTLYILKDESERPEDTLDGQVQNRDAPNPRKRKAPTPVYLSIQEAAQQAHLLPRLIETLYKRYRTAITQQIRDDEDTYQRLQRELQATQRGERDQMLMDRQTNGKSPTPYSPSLTRKSPQLHRPPPPSPSPRPQFAVQDGDTVPAPFTNTRRPDGPQQVVQEPAKPLPSQNGHMEADTRVAPMPSPRPEHNMSPLPQPVVAPDPRSPQQLRTPQSIPPPPIFPQPQPSHLGYNGPPSQAHRPQYPVQGLLPPPQARNPQSTLVSAQTPPPMPQGSLQTGHAQPPLPQSLPPTTGPYPPGQARPASIQPHPLQTQSPTVHQSPVRNSLPLPPPLQVYGGNGNSQYSQIPSPSPQLSPTKQQFPGPYPSDHQSPVAQTPQQQRPIQPYNGQPAFPLLAQPQINQPSQQNQPQQSPQQSQQHFQNNQLQQPAQGNQVKQQLQNNQHPPPHGGFMLPPFQVSPQDPARAHQQPVPVLQPQISTPIARQPPPSSVRSGVSPGSAMRQGHTPMQPPSMYHFRGSTSTPLSGTPYSALGTPRSAKTLWKTAVTNVATPPTPRPEVSPIDDIVPMPQPKSKQAKTKVPRKPRAKGKAKESESEKGKEVQAERPAIPQEELLEDVPEMETRQGRSRRKATGKRARPGSIASSQAGGSLRERSRSRSVISHTETIAAENDSQSGTHVKTERDTPIDAVDEESATTPSQPSTRRRVGNLPPLQPRGRKRNAREASLAESEDQPSTPTTSSKVVIAQRHFSRMCNPIMNDIASHKHASTFTNPVKARDAPGYHSLIKRPTDLKTIQKAIGQGNKALTAAASDTPIGSPGGGGGLVELPLSADVVPPKAIVNSAQLEKELMRMFVNAVMFNAGEEGVVEDAREMYESVQRSVSNWRSAERKSGRGDAEGGTPVPAPTPAQDEVEGEKVAKRRKV